MLKRMASLLLLILVALSAPSCGEAPPHEDAPVLKQASFTCLAWYNGSCTWWQPELVPGARWCGANDVPGPYEVMVWTSQFFQTSPWPYCMAVPVTSHKRPTAIPDFGAYGWNGPTFHIESIRFGTSAMGWTYQGYAYGGQGSFWPVNNWSQVADGYAIESAVWYY